MSQKVKLFNKGKRVICGRDGGKEFKLEPQSPGAFSTETAAMIKRLYKGEVISLEDFEQQFEPKKEAPEEETAA